jgi:hypothetical protein
VPPAPARRATIVVLESRLEANGEVGPFDVQVSED